MTLEQIKAANNMYYCQGVAHERLKEKYPEIIKGYMEALKEIMEKKGLDEVEALVFATRLDSVKANAGEGVLFYAAAVELLEWKANHLYAGKVN